MIDFQWISKIIVLNAVYFKLRLNLQNWKQYKKAELSAAARKPRDAEAIFDKARLQSSTHIGALCSSSMRCLVRPRGSMPIILWT